MIAGKANDLAGSWQAGYPLLLSPFFRLVPEVGQAWPSVVLVNALSLLVSFLCLWRALERSGAAERSRGFWLLVLGLLVFGSTAYVGWAFPNCLLMALVAAAAMLLAAPGLSPRRAAGVGALLGYATWGHPTGLLMLIAAALACLISPSMAKGWRSAAMILVIGGAMALGYSRVVHPWVNALQGGGGGHYDRQIADLIQQLLRLPLPTLATLSVGVINGMATSAIASFGYVGAALAATLKPPAPGAIPTARGAGLRRVLLFLLLSWGLLVLFSSALLPHEPTDLQLAFHQRYTQPVLPALVAFGMALAPRQGRGRLLAWLLSAVPILLALLASMRQPYNDNFSIVDQLGAVTFFLQPEHVPLMLAAGLATTGVVQLLGLRAFLPVAAGFWLLAWQHTDRLHRQILHADSRPPAMAAAAATLGRSGLQVCVSTAQTASSQGEHGRLMRYYLSGQAVTFVGPEQAWPVTCDLRIRPVDLQAAPPSAPAPGGDRPCLPVVADTHAKEVLEDCRGSGGKAALTLETRLLPASRDLVALNQVRQHKPPGFGVVALLHRDALPPEEPRNGAWWSAARGALTPESAVAGKVLLYGPYISLTKGRYRAVFDGLVLHTGRLEMAVTSEAGKEQHGARQLLPGGGPAAIDFSLQQPAKDVEILLRAQSKALLQPPTSLVIYGDASVGSSPWSSLAGGR